MERRRVRSVRRSPDPANILPPGWKLADLQSSLDRNPAAVWTDRNKTLTVSRVGSRFVLKFWNIETFVVDPDERSVAPIARSADMTTTMLEHLLADQVLPRLAAHDGALVVHAGAVRHPAGAIAILGESGVGKSTLVGSLGAVSQPILSDDALIVAPGAAGATARAVYPGLRLLPDSIAALFPGAIGTDPVADYTEKLRLRVDGVTDGGTHPLGLLVFLDPPGDGDTIALRPMTVSQTCMGLIANSFALDPTDRARAAARMAQAGAVANRVTSVALSYPRDYARLAEVRAAIVDRLLTSGMGGIGPSPGVLEQ